MPTRRSKGVVATEAVLSFGLLLLIILTLWSLARIVYDQTNLETATRFAAQAALTSYIQNAPIICKRSDIDDPDSDNPRIAKCAESRAIAGQNALSVLDINTNENRTRSLASESDFREREDPEEGGSTTGGYGDLLSDVLSEKDPMYDGPERLDVQCAVLRVGQLDPVFPAESEDGCDIREDDLRQAQAVVIRVTVRASGESIDRGFLGETLNLLGDFDAEASAYGWRRLN